MRYDKSALQSQLEAVKFEITYLEKKVKITKQIIQHYYERSDVSKKEETKTSFEALNCLKDDNRRLKSRIKALAITAKLLKDEIRGRRIEVLRLVYQPVCANNDNC